MITCACHFGHTSFADIAFDLPSPGLGGGNDHQDSELSLDTSPPSLTNFFKALTNRWGAAKLHYRIKAVQNLLRSNGLGVLAALPTECPALAKEDLRAVRAEQV